jgi:dihydrofolate synthase/folylpolyglutamate synthase
MGGRLDCTNIVNPLVSVITLIELEHTAILGRTIPAVAGEKAGIIKEGKPLVLARQDSEALDVLIKRAAEKKAKIVYFPEIAAIENVTLRPDGTDFSLVSGGKPLDLFIPIPGMAQAQNAGLAAIALRTAFPGIGDDVIRNGLARVKIPARFEKIAVGKNSPPVIVDGAHTPESVLYCTETFCSLYGEGGILLFGCAADKNAAAMAEIALPRFSRIIITAPGTFRMSNPEKVYEAFSGFPDHLPVVRQVVRQAGSDKVALIDDTSAALRQALEISREKALPVLCTGSFYLVSEVSRLTLALTCARG